MKQNNVFMNNSTIVHSHEDQCFLLSPCITQKKSVRLFHSKNSSNRKRLYMQQAKMILCVNVGNKLNRLNPNPNGMHTQ